MLFGFAYAVISPIILPCCWFYFLTGFISYRYNLVNFYERGYDSGACAYTTAALLAAAVGCTIGAPARPHGRQLQGLQAPRT